MPRRLRYQVAASLDGYIAGPEGEFDWIPMDPDIDFAELFAQYDALLMGRKTWDAAQAMHGGGTPFGMRCHVVSTTLDAAPAGVELIAADVEARVRELKAEPGRDIWLFGGGALCARLLDAELVDTIEPAIVPILLGGGVAMIAPTKRRHPLRLVHSRLYDQSGIQLLTYEVQRADVRSSSGSRP